MVKVLYNVMAINYSIPKTLIVSVLSIDELYSESAVCSGVFLFFNGKKELIYYGCSYNDIVSHAKNNANDESIYGYILIKDEENPLTEREVDTIYSNFEKNWMHISVVNETVREPINIILN